MQLPNVVLRLRSAPRACCIRSTLLLAVPVLGLLGACERTTDRPGYLGPVMPCGGAGYSVRTDHIDPGRPDVLVYGATPSGVAAALEAARLGQHVVLLHTGVHIGGMMSGGLGNSDVGNVKAIGGIARDFFTCVGAAYGSSHPAYRFEPHAAERVFDQMLAAAGVLVIRGERITSVDRTARTIRSVTTEAGMSISASAYVDATYESDLMALAGVSYAVGRESNATFNETRNGTQTPGKLTSYRLDTYVVPGDPASGLLPRVNPGPPLPAGSADQRVEAYNYRLCVTRDPANRLPFPPPLVNHPLDFELMARWFEAEAARGRTPALEDVVYLGPIPNEKYDLNNKGLFSTDLVGGSDAYPIGDPATRDLIAAQHQEYIRGFFQFLATSPRVPSSLRMAVSELGLCKDEFVDNGGWPYQLYVREGRRMIGAYIMTEHDLMGATAIPDPVALGSYAMDSHYVQRMSLGGDLYGEGQDWLELPGPYPISYRALTPQRDEVSNLLVPVCMSASRAALKSLRMEPVYMGLGHAAGAAAALAVVHRTSVQDVDYTELRDVLEREGQKLSWP